MNIKDDPESLSIIAAHTDAVLIMRQARALATQIVIAHEAGWSGELQRRVDMLLDLIDSYRTAGDRIIELRVQADRRAARRNNYTRTARAHTPR